MSVRRVSDAIHIPDDKEFDVVREAIFAIDRVHQDGQFPGINVLRGSSGNPNWTGLFDDSRNELHIYREAGNTAHAVVYHEIGHVIDLYGLPPFGSLSSHVLPDLDSWRLAVFQSPPVQRALAARATATPRGRKLLDTYFLTEHELFARSYAEYIAIKTGDVHALQILLAETGRLAGGIVLDSHWNPSDFQPISSEFDSMFRALGWIP